MTPKQQDERSQVEVTDEMVNAAAHAHADYEVANWKRKREAKAFHEHNRAAFRAALEAALSAHLEAQGDVAKDAKRWRKVVTHAYIGFNTHTKTTQWFLRNIHARTGQTFQQAIDIAIAKTGGEW